MFYFAWADKDDLTFGPEFEVEDEEVFAFALQHAEGEFPSLDVDLRNPRIGLLASTRKQWAWLSYLAPGDSNATPLFFGRLIGVPQEMQDEVVRLSFVARPADYEEQRSDLADTMRAFPYYDPAFMSDEDRKDPDRVLEGRSALWHIDRVTHEVTASDIITGEDGLVEFTPGEVIRDSVSVSYSESPARRVEVEATVQWDQRGSGEIDITQDILREFAEYTPEEVYAVDGRKRPSKGVVNAIAGDGLIDSWPKFGQAIGGGWRVGQSFAEVAGAVPLPPILMGDRTAYAAIQRWSGGPPGRPGSDVLLRSIFDRSPGFVVEIINTTPPDPAPWLNQWYNRGSWNYYHSDVNIMWLPIWQLTVKMKLQWEASRSRTEVLRFAVDADVQPLLTDPGEQEILRITAGPVDVDNYIPDRRSERYFGTGRGARSFEYLLARARANLLARARAVDVTFSVPFDSAVGLSCRKSAKMTDPRIPGGEATGKVKAYSLTADGDSGLLLASLTIGCTVGRGGTVTAEPGDPSYAEDGYVDDPYQHRDGQTVVPFSADLSYTGLGAYSVDSDGVNLYNVRRGSYLTSLVVDGGLTRQQETVRGKAMATAPEVIDRVNGFENRISLTLKPVAGGPFETLIVPSVSELRIPRTIDLEESA